MVVLQGGSSISNSRPPDRTAFAREQRKVPNEDGHIPLGPIVTYRQHELEDFKRSAGGEAPVLIGRANQRRKHLKARLEEMRHWYPFDDPNLVVVPDQLNLDEVAALSPGRFCDTHPLVAAVMAVPLDLHRAFDGSPRALELGAINCPRRALEEHADFVTILLEHNVKVFLVLQEWRGLHANPLTEAVFTQDPFFALGTALCIANMGHPIRRPETEAFKGRFQIRNFCEPGGYIEGGDVILLHGDARRPREPIQVVFQGFNGLRSNPASIRGMRRLLDTLRLLRAIDPFELVPMELAGPHILHLDYAMSIVGQGDQRTLIVYPEALKEGHEAVRKIAAISGAKNVIEVSMTGMEAGLCNLGIINEKVVVMGIPTARRFLGALEEFESVTAELKAWRFKPIARPYAEPAKKDGLYRCTHGRFTAPSASSPLWMPA